MSERNQYLSKVKTQLRPTTVSKTVAINATVPHFVPSLYNKTRDAIGRLPRRTVIIGASLIVIALSATGGYIISNRQSAVATDDDDSFSLNSLTGDLTKGTPEFETLLPAGKSIETLGGWTRVSPPERNPVFAFVDQIGEARVSVSQQPLPGDFKEDTEIQVEQLALGYKANQKITVDGSTVYIGTSTNGPQSVIFSKDDLLILIKSNLAITTDNWTKYISSLKQ